MNDYAAMVVAVLGTTISPYLFFWQSSQEVEEIDQDDAKHALTKRPLLGLVLAVVLGKFASVSDAIGQAGRGLRPQAPRNRHTLRVAGRGARRPAVATR